MLALGVGFALHPAELDDFRFPDHRVKNFVVYRKIRVAELPNEYLFTVTGVKKMKWFLSVTRCHLQPRVTEGHEWLEMAPSEK